MSQLCRPVPGKQHVKPGNMGTYETSLEWDLSRLSILHPAANNIEEMRRLMRKYVDFRLEYPLKSLDFLETLQVLPPAEQPSGGEKDER